jgi:hypothetical protein
MESTNYDDLKRTLEAGGPAQAIDRLCATLKERKEYANLFYALLMKKRFELGVSPMPTAPSSELPTAVHEPYESAIRESARQVGQLYIDDGELLKAAPYFRMIDDRQPLAAALEKYQPFEGEDLQPMIELAFHMGAHPKKGFDWLLDRYGICSAITTMGGHMNGGEFAHGPEARDYCICKLVRALHDQLSERVRADIIRREGSVDQALRVPQLIEGRDWLFEDDNYHVDTSHLSAVVQMSNQLSPCPELTLARELCAYGQKLSPRFQYQAEPPFDEPYKDYGVYLAIIDGDHVDEGIAHFKKKIEDNADPDMQFTQPAEMLVNLLLRIGRPEQALEIARKYLQGADERQLSCPTIPELCRRLKDYQALAEVSRERNDPVNFMAGLILANGSPGS